MDENAKWSVFGGGRKSLMSLILNKQDDADQIRINFAKSLTKNGSLPRLP